MSASPVAAVPNAEPTQLVAFEGFRVTEHRLNFGGNILLTDGDVVKEMKLDNDEVALIVRGRVASRKFNGKKDGEGNRLGAHSSTTIIVDSVALYADE